MRPDTRNHDPAYEKLVAQEELILDATELIADLLQTQNVTRQELAKRLGKSKGFVSQVLSGERNMTLRTLADMATALDQRLRLHAEPLHGTATAGASVERLFVAPLRRHASATACRGGESTARARSACPSFEAIGGLWAQNGRRTAAEAKADRSYSLVRS